MADNQNQHFPPLMLGANDRLYASANFEAALKVVRDGCAEIVEGELDKDRPFWADLGNKAGVAVHYYGSPRLPGSND